MKIGWVASDMDGTFLGTNHQVSPRNVDMYLRLQSIEFPIIVATGRSLAALRRILEINNPEFLPKFKFFPGIYCNGTIIFGDKGDIVYEAGVDVELLKLFAKATYDYNAEQSSGPPLTMFLQHATGSYTDWESEYYKDYRDHWCEEVSEELKKTIVSKLNEKGRGWLQISAVGEPSKINELESRILRSKDLMERFRQAGLRIVKPIAYMLTAIPASESKQTGLEKLMKNYPNLTQEEMLVIGDGQNDIEMLRMTDNSIAMGQAPNFVKDAACHVTGECGEDGWCEAMRRFILESGVIRRGSSLEKELDNAN
eukprot:Gregarina_sp_Pseudo_9__1853@NODE_2265_length_1071_cov_9_650194_g2084_i0_p1_GENE_NODE_2265_length_1071_cov_9_650194_g2084_i0NODE_2265_length_1071_cov_9_650194_g2084_i0_p1_ORF_typecomplete_len311_score47_48Hydrolase_3/PF08282_12/1_5e43S6PP/PF05116_13/19S6PP/PF05116_13/1_1e07HAD/PF12710_7/2_7e03HAD/PF12710_7/5_6e02HAD/PF12710_7/0_059HAD_2/PF13419_6/84HAD_2/PF13419_6/3_2_NODE_2265_length_1071_cov_9_650194_g2084_i051983